MKLTLLIDMDDTLLSNPFETFMPLYLQSLGSALSSKVVPQKMVPQLLKATDAMIQNNDFRLTLEECFNNNFYSQLNLKKEEIAPLLEKFYTGEFQKIKQVTRIKTDAISFIQRCFEKEITVAVATNPLFPLQAMQSRLRWGNLSPDEYPFSLVTAYESFHFSKPNPAYYAEILAQLGSPETPVVMIGNSITDDITPASSLGIKTFFLKNKKTAYSG